jgi:hypothetical protein
MFLILFFRVTFISIEDNFSHPNHSIPQKYTILFADNCLKSVKIAMSSTTKWRDTVSAFIFQKKYLILFCKLIDTSSIPLNNYIKDENISSYWQTSLNAYVGFKFGGCYFRYLPREPSSKNYIVFRHCCDSLNCLIKQKDRVYFSGTFSTTSICKGNDYKEDLVFITPGSTSKQLSVLFLRNKNGLFFIAMRPYDDIKMDPKLLWYCIK